MISIINYGIGNLGSVKNMLKKIGVESRFVTTAEEVKAGEKFILPGVGAFDMCMQNLMNSGMLDAINDAVLIKKKPVLGICVGYQMMTMKSEEGQRPGLGWLKAETIKFRDDTKALKIPHMGWNYLHAQKKHPLVQSFSQDPATPARAYFVHSYYVRAQQSQDVALETHYIQNFASGMIVDNMMGVQFHPEKSHRFGMQLFKSFAEL